MVDDYRRTLYEGSAEDVKANKAKVEKKIKTSHPRTEDLHNQLRKNDKPYKIEFIEAYGGKCAYCGISIDLIEKRQFEIDHFIPHTDRHHFESKKEAGSMDNLVLACYDCNRNKKDYSVSDGYIEKLHPDGEIITRCFFRNDDYYIKVNKDVENDAEIVAFYNKLRLGHEIHRLDYLLMCLIGLQKKHNDDDNLSLTLLKLIKLLLKKRNIGVSE